MPEPGIETRGLREFRRDLKRINPLIEKELRQAIRTAALRVRSRVVTTAPRLTGELAGSFRVSVTTRGASIYSRLPQAPVLEFGGTIEPRGVPITFPRTEFVGRAVDTEADRLVEDISDGINHAAHRAGWH